MKMFTLSLAPCPPPLALGEFFTLGWKNLKKLKRESRGFNHNWNKEGGKKNNKRSQPSSNRNRKRGRGRKRERERERERE